MLPELRRAVRPISNDVQPNTSACSIPSFKSTTSAATRSGNGANRPFGARGTKDSRQRPTRRLGKHLGDVDQAGVRKSIPWSARSAEVRCRWSAWSRLGRKKRSAGFSSTAASGRDRRPDCPRLDPRRSGEDRHLHVKSSSCWPQISPTRLPGVERNKMACYHAVRSWFPIRTIWRNVTARRKGRRQWSATIERRSPTSAKSPGAAARRPLRARLPLRAGRRRFGSSLLIVPCLKRRGLRCVPWRLDWPTT